MKLTNGQLAKAKTAKSAEELLALAKAEGIALSKEEATKYFADLHKEGELSDDELDNVSGGCGEEETPPDSRFHVGDWISAYFLRGYHYKVLSATWTGSDYCYYCYLVLEEYDGRICKSHFTLYESNMTCYVKEDYAHADLYVDVT